ncbi:MAG: endonuclease V [Candidatus Hadarchaeum sp.]|nr:endonuclease V [Candidatus Hadarchaeum sp.]
MLPILKPLKFDLNELARIQEKIAKNVVRKNRFKKLETIAGCDLSFASGDEAYAACALLDYKSLELIDKKIAKVKVKFPYIPTFLAFREFDPMLKVAQAVDADVFMIGAQGIAHPRRAGLASHFGVLINKPTVGVAKGRLCGEAEEPPNKRGAYSLLKDGKEVIGAVLRTQKDAKPVYVSIGHKLSLKTSIKITFETVRENRLPEPLRVAHELATRAMRS